MRSHAILALLLLCGCAVHTPSVASAHAATTGTRPLSGPTTRPGQATKPSRTARPSYVYPVIKGYGRALPLPQAAVQPSAAENYRVVFNITSAAKEPSEINPGLEKVARFINIYATAGVRPEQMNLVAVVHGKAIDAVLNDRAHRERNGSPNPNLQLLTALRHAGVKLYVCGQTLAHQKIARADVAKPVTVALAALTVVPHYQLKGYASLSF